MVRAHVRDIHAVEAGADVLTELGDVLSEVLDRGQQLGQLAREVGIRSRPVGAVDALLLGVGPGDLETAQRRFAAGVRLEALDGLR